MKLNENSWHARLFKVFYDKVDLPQDLCNYFWGLLLAIVCLPIIWPALILRIFSSQFEIDIRGSLIWVVLGKYILLFLCGVLGYGLLYNVIGFNYWVSVFLGLPLIFVVILLLVCIGYFSEKYRDYLVNRSGKENKSNIIIEYIKARKNKYCPKIEWKDK